MIIVLADDFTGAAELSGIAASHCLETRVVTPEEDFAPVHVNIIDTNTRSRSWEDAAPILRGVMERLKTFPHRLLYKKTDSVFRGHVYPELRELLHWHPERSVLLAPANPTRGRTITDGTYLIDGVRLHETVFSSDPETPIETSRVLDLMRSPSGADIRVLSHAGELAPEPGRIFIAEAKSSGDVLQWASKLTNPAILPAGGADFFDAILSVRASSYPLARQKSLFICGSSLSHLANLQDSIHGEAPAVIHLDANVLSGPALEESLHAVSDRIAESFQTVDHVILLAKPDTEYPVSDMPRCLADVARQVMHLTPVHELYIEGGTTSSEVVRKLGWKQFKPIRQVAPGVVRLKVVSQPDRHLTVKPGSYAWPEHIRQLTLDADPLSNPLP